jgi:hypothetical protein
MGKNQLFYVDISCYSCVQALELAVGCRVILLNKGGRLRARIKV